MELRYAALQLLDQLRRRLASDLDQKDIHLELHVFGKLLDENVVSSDAAIHRLKFKRVVVVRQLDANCLCLFGGSIAVLGNLAVVVERFSIAIGKVRNDQVGKA